MPLDETRRDELIFTLQKEVAQLKEHVKELSYTNREHKQLNGLLRVENKRITKEFRELQAKVNIKVMNGQGHMSNKEIVD